MSTRSLTLAEARRRVTQVESPSYDVHLDLTDPATGTFGSRSTVRFTPRAESTFLELADAAEVSVVVDGTPVAAAYDAGRIALAGLAPGVVTQVTVEARLPYVTHGDGMHIFTDPADGETYVSAYCGMDIAHRVFASFDQNDLKGPIALTVTADPAWTVLGNGRPTTDGEGHWELTATPPVPSRCSSCAPARGTPSPGTTTGCPAAGTPAGRWPRTSTATRTSCAAPPTPSSTTWPRCSPSPTRSTRATRSSCRVSTGAPRRTRAASPTGTRCCRASAPATTCAASAPPSSPTSRPTCGSATW